MALIGTETFCLTRLWALTTINNLETQPDLFSKSKMRKVRVLFSAGDNMLKSIRGWMLAAQLIEGSGHKYYVTNYAKSIVDNDKQLTKSATWWAIHLSICFSERNEPYAGFFRSLDVFSKEWKALDDIITVLGGNTDYAEKSLISNMEGVKSMFIGDGPLSGLALINIRKGAKGSSIELCLGEPVVPEEVIIFALALARYHEFPSRQSVDFSELEKCGICHFLCLSPEQLRKRLKEISHSQRWNNYIVFTNVANLDSISFGDSLTKTKTLISLLQESNDTWL